MEKETILNQVRIYKTEIDEIDSNMEELKRRRERTIERLHHLEKRIKKEDFS